MLNAIRPWGLFCSLVLGCALFGAQHPALVERTFSHTEDVGFGNSVFLVGDAAILGGGDPAKGVKLRFTAGNVWTAMVAVPSNTGELDYQFVSRSTDPSVYCSSSNTAILTTASSLPADTSEAAPYTGKTIYYHSAWTEAYVVYWSESAGAFVQTQLEEVGAGRIAGEKLFKLSGFGIAGDDLTFALTNGAGQWDNAFGQAGVNYQTNLDFFFVQDGHVFNYQPAATVSVPRFETRLIGSTAPGILERNIKIYLPRGYDSHPTKRYPVLYMHDGQNVFSPGGAFGSWDVDLTANAEIQMGRVRECIIVAIDNTADRLSEYLSPTDNFNGDGRCDDYADFVINNVRPTLDVNYRTLNDPSNTLLMGSSFGGIATIYMGWEHHDVFGKLGVLSPSWWAIPNLRNQMRDALARSERVFLYWGTEESSGSADAATWWPPFLDGYDIYLSQGYHTGGDFLSSVGCGLAHNEAAWASQMETALRFLLCVNDAPNELAYLDGVPSVSITVVPETSVALTYPALSGYSYQVEATDDLKTTEPWDLVSLQHPERIWQTLSAEEAISESDTERFYRIRPIVP
ncbi:MAG: alpha/beta hydrolase-fold protein [Opitutaceae bacterium]